MVQKKLWFRNRHTLADVQFQWLDRKQNLSTGESVTTQVSHVKTCHTSLLSWKMTVENIVLHRQGSHGRFVGDLWNAIFIFGCIGCPYQNAILACLVFTRNPTFTVVQWSKISRLAKKNGENNTTTLTQHKTTQQQYSLVVRLLITLVHSTTTTTRPNTTKTQPW